MKKIIILDVKKGPGGDTSVQYAFWFPIPLARRVPKAGKSFYRDASAGELSALQDGSVIEEVNESQFTGATVAQIKSFLQNKYAIRESAISALPNPNQYYGTSWDGTTWS